MYVDNATKTLFFHNPKTAGRSIVVGLGFAEDTHHKLVHFDPVNARRCIFQDDWDRFFSFGFVRNPWDRLVSLYEYHRSVEYGVFQRMNDSHQMARRYDFDDWVCINMNATKRKRSNWFGTPQTFWIEGVTAAYKFEEYDQAFRDIALRMGKQMPAPYINKSSRSHYRNYYLKDATIEIVANMDAHVISKFGYTF
ncbi:sulfotransferase family 2 domain-containing protein [Dyella jejuensis]|uniref:Sulfotransferase family 2 domain-containing protein n=1 Tax=Dyella jejuensis TaxID=1432009 RepID=A0ABW8JK54_9GAMM